jgi:uncharacterized protein YbjT (DUF2867 family)
MILVTGAGGAVGSALMEELRGAGRPARGAYHSPEGADRARRAGWDAVTVDLSRPPTLPAALEGVDAIFLLGATGPEQTRQELNAVEAARAAGVGRIVKLSVWRADEGLTPIGLLHRPVEEAIASSGLPFTLLRPNFYMQNFSRQMGPSIRTRGVFAQQATDAPISFADVRDVARVAARVLTSAGHDARAYEITGPEALTYEDAAGVLSRVLQRPVRFVGMSDDEARAALTGRGLPGFHVDLLIEVGRAYRHGGAERVTPAVRELTGRDPISFEQFVRDHRGAFA